MILFIIYLLADDLPSPFRSEALGEQGLAFLPVVHDGTWVPCGQCYIGGIQHMFVAWMNIWHTLLETQGCQGWDRALAFITSDVGGHLVTVSSGTFHLKPPSLRFISEFNQM